MPQEGSTFVKFEDNAKTDNKNAENCFGQVEHLHSLGGESIIENLQDNRQVQVDNSLSNENAYFTSSLIETSNSNSEISA